ncbi:MAG: helix-turn-helix domain-containing protein [Aeromicrobium erythreum]
MAEYMTTEEVAELARTKPETVRYWRHIRKGPASFKVGRRVLYARIDVEKWLEDARAAAVSG